MIIIFGIFLTTVFAQQNKNIDFLPNNEKQDFLYNVARRIMKPVARNGTNKESIELTEAQLNKHDSFVQSVMEQETTAFKADKREGRSSGEDSKSKENDRFIDGMEVKSFQFRDNGVDKFDSSEYNMGLTVAGLNHPSNDKTPQDNITDNNSKMDKFKTDSLLLQTKSVTSDVNSEKTTEVSTIKNSNEDKGKSTLDSEKQMQDSEPVESTTETQQLIIEITKTFENISQYETTSKTNVPLSVTAISSTHKVENAPTKTTTGSKIQLLEYISTKKSVNFEPSSNATESYTQNFEPSSNVTEYYIQNINNSYLTSSLSDESTTNLVIDTTTNEYPDLLTTLNSKVFTTTTQNTAEVNTAITEDRLTKEYLQTTTESTTFTQILTTSNIEEKRSTNKPKKIQLSKTMKQIDNDTLVSYVASKALKNIKHELELKKQGKYIDSEIKTNKVNTHLNHYRVYEILWPIKRDNQPFLRSQEPIKEQPFFVPVYKYSPNFVYYNAKNRLGPNEVEEKSIELYKHLREGNNDIHDKVEPSEFILQLNNELRKFGIRKHKRTTTTESPFPNSPQTVLENEKEKEAKAVKEDMAAEGNKAVDEHKSKEEITTLQDFINDKDGKDSFYSTLAPTTNMFGFTGFDCESADKETAGCETSKKIVKKKRSYNKNKGPTIAKIMRATDTMDLLVTLEKLQALDIPLGRSKPESKVYIYMNVLKDLILEDSKSLKQYDWLTTTVQIQSALSKILTLIKRFKQSMQLYPAELQVLRYMVLLHNFSLELNKNNELGNKLRKRMKFLPRNKKKWKSKLLKEKGLINRVWLYLRTLLPDLVEDDGLSNLYEFLIGVQHGLFDLHEAIRHIADVAKFNRQNWYENLKQLYLSENENHLRELLLHISMSRLVDLVEHSCKHSLDHDFIKFVKTNKKDAKRIVEEMIFINDIVHEITINKE